MPHAFLSHDLDLPIWALGYADDSAVDDNIDASLPGDLYQAIVKMVSMYEPPWVSKSIFDSLDHSVSNLPSILVSEIEVTDSNQIVANDLVHAIADEESRCVRSLALSA